ncbi:hypothetical protein IE81DRAFT_340734 [Ceraceosorus guamensis]|uniref:Protein kinase domain-containing protein n=1 Tax=Ceraceosorus guamensis TaxID=1522189 RepID=A0A316W7D5_9BASI|nr:hypothetical protein IE81DRAFT_340734 [Ceraceosorus guamensis]PWN43555.1 hypothetical protein IE81DRAFT_340734 [Ceraceosorus guamensis]
MSRADSSRSRDSAAGSLPSNAGRPSHVAALARSWPPPRTASSTTSRSSFARPIAPTARVHSRMEKFESGMARSSASSGSRPGPPPLPPNRAPSASRPSSRNLVASPAAPVHPWSHRPTPSRSSASVSARGSAHPYPRPDERVSYHHAPPARSAHPQVHPYYGASPMPEAVARAYERLVSQSPAPSDRMGYGRSVSVVSYTDGAGVGQSAYYAAQHDTPHRAHAHYELRSHPAHALAMTPSRARTASSMAHHQHREQASVQPVSTTPQHRGMTRQDLAFVLGAARRGASVTPAMINSPVGLSRAPAQMSGANRLFAVQGSPKRPAADAASSPSSLTADRAAHTSRDHRQIQQAVAASSSTEAHAGNAAIRVLTRQVIDDATPNLDVLAVEVPQALDAQEADAGIGEVADATNAIASSQNLAKETARSSLQLEKTVDDGDHEIEEASERVKTVGEERSAAHLPESEPEPELEDTSISRDQPSGFARTLIAIDVPMAIEQPQRAAKASKLTQRDEAAARSELPPTQVRQTDTQPIQSGRVPAPAAKPSVALSSWFLTLVSLRRGPSINDRTGKLSYWFYVEGVRMNADGDEEQWHSSFVHGRKDSRTVNTTSGSLYTLIGPINRDKMSNLGWGNVVISHFEDGFPEDWLDVVCEDIEHRQALRERSASRAEAAATAASSNRHAAKRKRTSGPTTSASSSRKSGPSRAGAEASLQPEVSGSFGDDSANTPNATSEPKVKRKRGRPSKAESEIIRQEREQVAAEKEARRAEVVARKSENGRVVARKSENGRAAQAAAQSSPKRDVPSRKLTAAQKATMLADANVPRRNSTSPRKGGRDSGTASRAVDDAEDASASTNQDASHQPPRPPHGAAASLVDAELESFTNAAAAPANDLLVVADPDDSLLRAAPLAARRKSGSNKRRLRDSDEELAEGVDENAEDISKPSRSTSTASPHKGRAGRSSATSTPRLMEQKAPLTPAQVKALPREMQNLGRSPFGVLGVVKRALLETSSGQGPLERASNVTGKSIDSSRRASVGDAIEPDDHEKKATRPVRARASAGIGKWWEITPAPVRPAERKIAPLRSVQSVPNLATLPTESPKITQNKPSPRKASAPVSPARRAGPKGVTARAPLIGKERRPPSSDEEESSPDTASDYDGDFDQNRPPSRRRLPTVTVARRSAPHESKKPMRPKASSSGRRRSSEGAGRAKKQPSASKRPSPRKQARASAPGRIGIQNAEGGEVEGDLSSDDEFEQSMHDPSIESAAQKPKEARKAVTETFLDRQNRACKDFDSDSMHSDLRLIDRDSNYRGFINHEAPTLLPLQHLGLKRKPNSRAKSPAQPSHPAKCCDMAHAITLDDLRDASQTGNSASSTDLPSSSCLPRSREGAIDALTPERPRRRGRRRRSSEQPDATIHWWERASDADKDGDEGGSQKGVQDLSRSEQDSRAQTSASLAVGPGQVPFHSEPAQRPQLQLRTSSYGASKELQMPSQEIAQPEDDFEPNSPPGARSPAADFLSAFASLHSVVDASISSDSSWSLNRARSLSPSPFPSSNPQVIQQAISDAALEVQDTPHASSLPNAVPPMPMPLGLASAAAALYGSQDDSQPAEAGIASRYPKNNARLPSSLPSLPPRSLARDDEGALICGGRFQLGRTLGFGGSSTVREALDRGGPQHETASAHQAARVAVKIVQLEAHEEEAEAEAGLWSSLPSHAHLLPLLEREVVEPSSASDKRLLFLVMPLADAGSLLNFVRAEGGLSVSIDEAGLNGVVNSSNLRSPHGPHHARPQSTYTINRSPLSSTSSRTGSGFLPGRTGGAARIMSDGNGVAISPNGPSSLTGPRYSGQSPGGLGASGGLLRRASSRAAPKSRGIPLAIARDVMAQLCAGLRVLQSLHIRHGDLKLENVLGQHAPNGRGGDGRRLIWRLADFGLSCVVREHQGASDAHGVASLDTRESRAKLSAAHPTRAKGASESAILTNNHAAVSIPRGGSLAYAAPEALRTATEQSQLLHKASPFATDHWALGCIFYALLAGRLPFTDSFEPRLQLKITRGAWSMPNRLARRNPRRSRTSSMSVRGGSADAQFSRLASAVQPSTSVQSFTSDMFSGPAGHQLPSQSLGAAFDMSASLPALPAGAIDWSSKVSPAQRSTFGDDEDASDTDDEAAEVDKATRLWDGTRLERSAARELLRGLLEPDAGLRWNLSDVEQCAFLQQGGKGAPQPNLLDDQDPRTHPDTLITSNAPHDAPPAQSDDQNAARTLSFERRPPSQERSQGRDSSLSRSRPARLSSGPHDAVGAERTPTGPPVLASQTEFLDVSLPNGQALEHAQRGRQHRRMADVLENVRSDHSLTTSSSERPVLLNSAAQSCSRSRSRSRSRAGWEPGKASQSGPPAKDDASSGAGCDQEILWQSQAPRRPGLQARASSAELLSHVPAEDGPAMQRRPSRSVSRSRNSQKSDAGVSSERRSVGRSNTSRSRSRAPDALVSLLRNSQQNEESGGRTRGARSSTTSSNFSAHGSSSSSSPGPREHVRSPHSLQHATGATIYREDSSRALRDEAPLSQHEEEHAHWWQRGRTRDSRRHAQATPDTAVDDGTKSSRWPWH